VSALDQLRQLRDTNPEAFKQLPAKLMTDPHASHEARFRALDHHATIAAEVKR
jgi:hypothetical protein